MLLPVIETERLILRPLKETDAGEIFLLRSDEAVNQYVDRPRATSIDDAIAFINKIIALTRDGGAFYKAITLKGSEQLIGTVALWNFDRDANKAEIGYEMLPSYHGNGYMTEAVKAVIGYAFSTLRFSAIEGWTHPGNGSSNKLLEKLGFKRDHEAEKTKPAEAKEIIYSLKNNDHS
jgi:[ribosomal protein S5]-alanine N-acetyltransferase